MITPPSLQARNVTVRIGLLLGIFEYRERGILDSSHLRFYTMRSIKRAIEGGGFRIIERRLTFGKNLILDNLGRMFSSFSTAFYEKHLAWIFPARNLVCRLLVIKPE